MRIEAFFSRNNLCLKNKTLVVATSGGPDSMALLDMLNTIKDDQHFHLIAAHLDHRLRPDSFREAAAIDQYCGKKQIKVVHGTWPQALHPQSGVEAAARRYRYDFLAQVMHKNAGDYLLTAHHCDDLLENILIKFIRSGDPSEMNSLQAVSGWRGALLLRPLLTLEKADLLAYVRSRGIPFVIDETNNEDEALRNRLRHQVIPVLKRENPHIGRSALRFNRRVNQMASIVARTFTQLGQPTPFLGVAFRLPQATLRAMDEADRLSFWQYFIWRTWHVRVNENLGRFDLIAYQGYFYLLPRKLPPQPAISFVVPEREFAFGRRRFVLTKFKRGQAQPLGRLFVRANAKLSAGPLAPGKKLLLKNGQHAKGKKKFAQAAIPGRLRPYCLTIYEGDVAVYVEQTYSRQSSGADLQEYYLYASN